ncbi:glycosyltransferase [Vibrio cyclitrophicus]|uniref:glycosyltransferase n=1 Tax=Vibrio cyclitrophicus TaxID=47951 RepID=UPI000C8510B7|nr:glycosyltransferase [Vibrio cyclitrophicus]PMK96681.1 hypothetical protein BCT87_09305 [Vibrio cyclitrophicus]
MRVCFFVGVFPKLSETFVLNQIKLFLEKGHEVDIFSLGKGNFPEGNPEYQYILDKANVKYLVNQKNSFLYSYIKSSLKVKKKFAFQFDIIKQISKKNFIAVKTLCNILSQNNNYGCYKYDAIISHFAPSGYYSIMLKKYAHMDGDIYTIFHGYDVSRYSFLAKWSRAFKDIFSESRYLLPVSFYWKDKLVSLGANENRIIVNRMGINIEKLPMNKKNSNIDNLEFISVGRLTEKKGILDAIQAVYQSEAKGRFNIIGNGELKDKVVDRVNNIKKSESKIKFNLLGAVPHQVVSEKLLNSDIFILPSKVAEDGDKEGVPVALMEAMASGVIVISTYHSGIPELINNNVTGFLVHEGDVEGITNVINAIKNGEHDIVSIKNSARKKVENDFNNIDEVDKLIKLIESK